MRKKKSPHREKNRRNEVKKGKKPIVAWKIEENSEIVEKVEKVIWENEWKIQTVKQKGKPKKITISQKRKK